MKYAIIKVSNGHYFIEAEAYTDLAKAKVKFHQVCTAMWDAPDVITGYVMLADENLDKVEGYGEYIHHEVVEEEPKEEKKRSIEGVPDELITEDTEVI